MSPEEYDNINKLLDEAHNKAMSSKEAGRQMIIDAKINTIPMKEPEKEAKQIKALELADKMLDHIGCVNGCVDGMIIINGEPSEPCQWCNERMLIKEDLKDLNKL